MPRRLGVPRIAWMLLVGLVPAVTLAYVFGAWAPMPRMSRALWAGTLLFPAWALAIVLLGHRVIRRRRAAADPPVRPIGTRRILHQLHLELGGVLTGVVFVLCFSGTAAVGARMLATWEQAPVLPIATASVPAVEAQPLDRILDQSLQDDPDLARGFVRVTPATRERPWIRLETRGGPGAPRVRDFEPTGGVAIADGEGPLHVLVDLHRNLLLPAVIGESLITALGVLLAALVACGLATRRHWSREALRIRLRRPVHELHKLLGIWTFVFALVAALSGSMLGGTVVSLPVMTASAYGGDRDAIIRDVLGVERSALDERMLPRVATATLVRERPCVDGWPAARDFTAHEITWAQPGFASGRTTVEHEGPGPWLDRGLVVFDAQGHVLDCRVLRREPGALQFFYATIAVHYAELGGRAQRVIEALWMMLGLALSAGAFAGAVVRHRRLARVGHAPGRWARGATVAIGVGLPLACVVLLLSSRVAPVSARAPGLAQGLFLATWAAAWIGATLPAAHVGTWARARPLVACVGVGLLSTALASFVCAAGSTVDLLWASLGAMTLGTLWLGRSRREEDP